MTQISPGVTSIRPNSVVIRRFPVASASKPCQAIKAQGRGGGLHTCIAAFHRSSADTLAYLCCSAVMHGQHKCIATMRKSPNFSQHECRLCCKVKSQLQYCKAFVTLCVQRLFSGNACCQCRWDGDSHALTLLWHDQEVSISIGQAAIVHRYAGCVDVHCKAVLEACAAGSTDGGQASDKVYGVCWDGKGAPSELVGSDDATSKFACAGLSRAFWCLLSCCMTPIDSKGRETGCVAVPVKFSTGKSNGWNGSCVTDERIL